MQQVELQVKRRMGIGSFLSERRLIDEIMRTGLGESTVSLLCTLWRPAYSLNICCYVWTWYLSCLVHEIVSCIIIFKMPFTTCLNVRSVISFTAVKFKFSWNSISNFVWPSAHNFCRYGEHSLWWLNEMRSSIGEKGAWLSERPKDVLVVMFLDVLQE